MTINIEAFEEVFAAVQRVRELHRPFRIYDECGHQHALDEDGVRDIEGIGLVCDEGLQYVICGECCTDGGDYQTEHCCDNHPHIGAAACYPCPTLIALDSAT